MTNATLTENKPSRARLTHADLCQFTGDLERFYHPLNRKVVYTPGVQYVAQVGQAYWLIDAIASYFGSEPMNTAMRRDAAFRIMLHHEYRTGKIDSTRGATASAWLCTKPKKPRSALVFESFACGIYTVVQS